MSGNVGDECVKWGSDGWVGKGLGEEVGNERGMDVRGGEFLRVRDGGVWGYGVLGVVWKCCGGVEGRLGRG